MPPAVTILAAALAGAALADPQPGRIENARIESRSAAAGLAPELRALASAQSRPAWVGYTVPAAGRPRMCCYDSVTVAGGECAPWTVALEPPARFVVLLRAEGGCVVRIRSFSEDCAIDAGGLPFYWLTDVRPAESVALLASFVSGGDGVSESRISEPALGAIAQHDDPSADAALINLARRDPSRRVRGQALFWLSQRAGRKAADAITRAIEEDRESDVKKKAVFALSQLPKDDGVPLLIRVARENRNPAVRKQAMFWLGQSNDPRALAFFEEVLTR